MYNETKELLKCASDEIDKWPLWKLSYDCRKDIARLYSSGSISIQKECSCCKHVSYDENITVAEWKKWLQKEYCKKHRRKLDTGSLRDDS